MCIKFNRHMRLALSAYFLTATAILAVLLGTTVQAAPSIQHWQTEQGMRVYYVPIKQLPMLDVRISFDAGSARDPNLSGQKKWGLASLTADMLSEGSQGLSADEIAQQFEMMGAEFSSGADRDKASISLRSVTVDDAHVDALSLMGKVLKQPLFSDAELQRLKKQYKVGFEAAKQRPNSIASQAFFKHLYQDHPYAHPVSGDASTIDRIKAADLKSFYQQYYAQGNGQVVLVGDIDKAEAEKIANAVAEIFPSGKPAPTLPEPKPLTKAKTVRIDFDSAQTTITMGQLGNYRGDPDYYRMYLANHPLGGSGFSARLMKEIRVKRGLSYGIYSYFMPLRQYGPFVLSVQTKNSSVDEALKTIEEVVGEYAKNGPTDAELADSKQNIEGGFPLRSASNSDILGYATMIGFYGLPLDYNNQFPKQVTQVTKAEIDKMLKARFKPQQWLTIIVGKQTDSAAKAAGHKSDPSSTDAESAVSY